MRRVCSYGFEKLKQWEGLKTSAYQDGAGIWTIGYGHTAKAGYPFPELGMKITSSEAETLLKRDLARFEKLVETSVKVALNDYQFSALVSFAYNVGESAFQNSTLLKALNHGLYHLVPQHLLRWVFIGKKKSKGLVNRRLAEIALWNKGAFVASNYVAVNEPGRLKEHYETYLPFLSSLSGLTAILSGTGPVQWVFAFGFFALFCVSFFMLWRQYCQAKSDF